MVRKLYDISEHPGFSRDIPTFWMGYQYYNPPVIGARVTPEGFPANPYHKGYYETIITLYVHTGCHMDAPIHMDPKGWAIDEIPLDYLVGDGVVVSIPKGEYGEITAEDLEKARPQIRKGDIVVINTGWHKEYAGPITDYAKALRFASKWPGLVRSGAEWLVKRGVKNVMMDVICADAVSQTEGPKADGKPGDGSYASHMILLPAGIPIVEGIGRDVDKVTGKRCTIIAVPPKVVKVDAMWCRVLAMVEE